MKKNGRIESIFDKTGRVIHNAAEILQILLAALIIAGIVVQLTSFPDSLRLLSETGSSGFHEFLQYVIDMVIGIELIQLLIHPNLDNVVEILLIALTRTLVLKESGPFETLAGIAGIAILFAVTKYLFIEKLDKE